jgi:hypothetical protein
MAEEAQWKKAVYRASAIGVAAVLVLVLAVRLLMPDFPSTSRASMAFIAARAFVAVANLFAALARIFLKVPARVPATRWMFALVVSRISFAWAMFLLVAVAVIGSIVGGQLSQPLFHTLIVEVMLGAFWLMASSTVLLVALFWTGR